jgi:hypothetical protein
MGEPEQRHDHHGASGDEAHPSRVCESFRRRSRTYCGRQPEPDDQSHRTNAQRQRRQQRAVDQLQLWAYHPTTPLNVSVAPTTIAVHRAARVRALLVLSPSYAPAQLCSAALSVHRMMRLIAPARQMRTEPQCAVSAGLLSVLLLWSPQFAPRRDLVRPARVPATP